MSMTRREHYRRAQELLEAAEPPYARGAERPRFTEVDRERLALASVHATLAAADPVVAEEYPERRVLDRVEVRLEAALEELAAMEKRGSRPLDVATFIRERVLGQDPGVDYRADSDRQADLVGRLVRLADDLEDAGPSHVARRIREELGR